MLTPDQIKKVIVSKLFRLQGCRDRATILKYIHVIRGMMTVLLERDPGDMDNVPDILDALEVPYYRGLGNSDYYIEPTWLEAHKIS